MSEDALNVDYADAEFRYNLFPLLGEAVGPQGHITGVDGSQSHLDAAEEFARQQGVQTPLTLVQADLRQTTDFADHSFDCAWCADVLWANIFPDPIPVVRELARVVKPGGTVAIFFGNFYRAQHVPGYRRLEWLAGTAENMRWKNEAPSTTPYAMPNIYERSLQWLQESGLHDCAVSIHPLLYQQPLPAAARDYLEGMSLPKHSAPPSGSVARRWA